MKADSGIVKRAREFEREPVSVEDVFDLVKQRIEKKSELLQLEHSIILGLLENQMIGFIRVDWRKLEGHA